MFPINSATLCPKKFHLEKEFQTWFGQECKKFGFLYHKISDQSRGLKPLDCWFVDWQGVTNWCELKILDGYTLNINVFEPQQVEYLTKVSKLGNVHSRAFTALYCKKNFRYILIPWEHIIDKLLTEWSIKVFEKL